MLKTLRIKKIDFVTQIGQAKYVESVDKDLFED
jgi:hypothetical protein